METRRWRNPGVIEIWKPCYLCQRHEIYLKRFVRLRLQRTVANHCPFGASRAKVIKAELAENISFRARMDHPDGSGFQRPGSVTGSKASLKFHINYYFHKCEDSLFAIGFRALPCMTETSGPGDLTYWKSLPFYIACDKVVKESVYEKRRE